MANKETLDAIEKTIDVVEDKLETIERIPKLYLNGTTKGQAAFILGITAASGALVGSVAGYFWAKKKLGTRFDEILEEEIERTKVYYSKVNKTGEFADPVKLAEEKGYVDPLEEAAVEAVREYSGAEPAVKQESEVAAAVKEMDPEPQVVVNVFNNLPVEEEEETFDFKEEILKRSELNGSEPYIIHHDEFFQNEEDFTQITFTYYEEDDVLADERDNPITDTDSTVGDDNLMRFGHGSKDHNIVYIRNPRLELDFEIHRSNGSYAQEVAGFIQHSDKRGGRRRFSDNDE